ncbi:MAG TPA: carbon storage regulator CsrA [Elusimicrobiota bacterium]|nr:carbon storage regulator CsrA [Elusimicrobiota bacterium]HMX94543.1 carbon storage regulator CsrA [Elusimicrobiota bacterium]HMZ27854.1 carbon storage regulator CsrA [Elusimicrobiota bacterium]HNC73422.1 carbon storage regulator CsrA [Elusimicrobiota bacterium]HND63689.1 carbon storage regulator CsrA [Elusimicrobiota bacterium]
MLLLSRRKGESLLIGDTVEITVLAVEGGNVRLGIRAPGAVPVYRRELYEAIRSENRDSAAAGVEDLSRALARRPVTPRSAAPAPVRRPRRGDRPSGPSDGPLPS